MKWHGHVHRYPVIQYGNRKTENCEKSKNQKYPCIIASRRVISKIPNASDVAGVQLINEIACGGEVKPNRISGIIQNGGLQTSQLYKSSIQNKVSPIFQRSNLNFRSPAISQNYKTNDDDLQSNRRKWK